MDLTKEFSAEDAGTIVNALSFPRMAGTEGEPKAIAFIDSKFKEIGLEFQKEPFQATKFWVATILQAGMGLALIIATLMVLFNIYLPVLNLIIIIIVLVIVVVALQKMTGKREMKVAGTPIATNNLFTKIPAKKDQKGIIIFMGHHDTKSQPLTTIQRTVGFTIGGLGLIIMLLIFLINAILSLIPVTMPLFLRVIGYIGYVMVVICAIPLMFNSVGNKSPGALDNASSVATLFQLGKYFKTNPLQNYAIWLILTGAEELGMMGARAFVTAHQAEMKAGKAYLLNFDMIGRKDTCVEVMETAGFPKKSPVSPFLNGLARKSAEKFQFKFNGFYLPIGAATDRYVFTAIGIDGTDFINQKAAFQTHSPRDLPDKFDPNIAKQVAIVATDVAISIDQMKEE